MKSDTDPAMRSAYERLMADAYFTIEAPMAIRALLNAVAINGRILEPAAGRGHLVKELRKYGLGVEAFDLRDWPEPLVDDIKTNCCLGNIRHLDRYDALVSNLPFDRQDEMLKRLLPIANRDRCLVAILARSTWCLPAKKRPLFFDHPYAAGIVHLPRRPWWFEKQPGDEGPRHEYSWYVWGTQPRLSDAILTYAPKEDDHAVRT